MKYICKDCGQVYDRLPHFCDCGNDSFTEEYNEADEYKERSDEFRRKSYRKKVEREQREQRIQQNNKEEKSNPISVILFFLLIAGIATILPSFIAKSGQEARNRIAQQKFQYMDTVQKQISAKFDPKGITKSGRCIAQFEINNEGWVSKRQLINPATSNQKLNDKVMSALKAVTIVKQPPAQFVNTPIKIEFYCSANEREAECLSKIVTKVGR